MVRNFIKYFYSPKLDASLFTTAQYKTFDSWNKKRNGQIKHHVLYDGVHIGFVDYRCFSGQICLISVEPNFRRKHIAHKMLEAVEVKLKANNVKKIWAVCSKDHYFWSNQTNYLFSENLNVGSGYSKRI